MIDPFSLATGLAGLVSLTIELMKVSHGYFYSIKEAPASIRAFVTEVMNLKRVISNLQDNILLEGDLAEAFDGRCSSILDMFDKETVDSADHDPSSNLIDLCKRDLDDLLEKLGKQTSGSKLKNAAKKLLWPLDEAVMQKSIVTLHRYRELFTTSIAIDTLALGAIALREIRASRRDQSKVREWLHDEKILRALEWLSPLEFAEKQQDTLSRWTEGTGTEFLMTAEFSAWSQASSSENVLWCLGEPGAGKTVIASLIIQHLAQRAKTNGTAIAYMYCDYKDQVQQTPSRLIGALNKQLARQSNSFPDTITELYTDATSSPPPLSLKLKEQTSLLLRLSRSFTKTFVVVDALDEVDDQKVQARSQLLTALVQLATEDIRLLIISRPHPADIRDKFGQYPQIRIEATKEDLRIFLHTQIESHGGLADCLEDKALRDQVITKLVEDAQGLFLLAALHIQRLNDHTCPAEIKESLDDVTSSLTDTYDQALERIERQSPSRRELAMNILMWISYSKRPLLIEELRHALAVPRRMKSFDKDKLRPPKVILDVCAGLVSIETESGTFRLIHYTVQEYLQRQSQRFLDADIQMGRVCLNYLLLDVCGVKPGEIYYEKGDLIKAKMPFLSYAAEFWGRHVHGLGELTLSDLIWEYFGDHPRCLMGDEHTSTMFDNLPRYWPFRAASAFGLLSILETLFQQGFADCSLFENALMAADKCDQTETLDYLLEREITLYKAGALSECTALPHSVRWERYDTLRRILSMGIDIDTQDGQRGDTALHWAVLNENIEVARLLLEKGANINARNLEGETPLLREASEEMAIFLINQGANVRYMCNTTRSSALHYAASDLRVDLVRLLLDHGALPHRRTSTAGSPLSCARQNFYTPPTGSELDATERSNLDQIVTMLRRPRPENIFPLEWFEETT